MEKKINDKIEKHQLAFKNSIKEWIRVNNITLSSNDLDKTSEFLHFIYDYNNLVVNKDDFQKRQRVKNSIPFCELCIAKIANGVQCTRRKQDDTLFCGTHIKGQPYGIVQKSDSTSQQTKKVDIWVQEIKGISYYIDSSNNVYKPEDILSNITNPSIIAKWALNDSNTYIISTFH